MYIKVPVHRTHSAKVRNRERPLHPRVRCRGVPPRDFLGITSLLGDLSGVYPVRQRQVLLTPKKYPPPQKTSKTTVPTHQTSATPQPSGGCQTLNFWGVGTVAKAPVWRVQSCMTKQSEERFFFGVCFLFFHTLCAGTRF